MVKFDDEHVRTQETNAQKLLQRADELLSHIRIQTRNAGVPDETLRNRAMVMAIMEKVCNLIW